jgi:predicted O-methyltransferase YrrM
MRERLASALARSAAIVPSHAFRRDFVQHVLERDPHAVLQAVGAAQNRAPRLSSMPLDLDPDGELEFEDLAGLFASSILNHGVIGMTIRQAAYVFGLARRSGATRAIEIGRWRGGSTIALAAGMGPHGKVWSIDIGEKAERMLGIGADALDAETADFCQRFGLDVEILVGDSRTIELKTGEVDVVLVDGDHTYEGVRADVERFGQRLRVGGALLLDDAYDDFFVPSHPESVGRLVAELQDEGAFRLVKGVDRLAHLERVA